MVRTINMFVIVDKLLNKMGECDQEWKIERKCTIIFVLLLSV